MAGREESEFGGRKSGAHDVEERETTAV